jgi:hypothetical protein
MEPSSVALQLIELALDFTRLTTRVASVLSGNCSAASSCLRRRAR